MTSDPICIGVSRCLLGEEVRYDGRHKRDALLLGALGPHVEWVPVCPEIEVGMGVPREPIHLVARADGVPSAGERVRLVAVRSRRDWTETMQRWASMRTRSLRRMNLSGYVLKKDSPSCGPEGVRVAHGRQTRQTGRGLFAQALMEALPNLPIEDEAALQDPSVRDHFIERACAYHRVRRLFAGRWTVAGVMRFHTAHTLQLRAHSREMHEKLGRLLAGGGAMARRDLAARYETAFMAALRTRATPGRHAAVLRHAAACLKGTIDSRDRDDIRTAIEEYRRGREPLAVPLALIREHARRREVNDLMAQTYLNPDPREIRLRGLREMNI